MDQEEKLAYIAGMMDGDGSFSITKKKPETIERSCLHSPLIQFGSVKKEAAELLKEEFGGSLFLRKASIGNDKITRREFYHWRLYGQEASSSLIKKLLPYLEVKKERAAFLLQYIEKNPFIRGSNKLEQEIIDSREIDYLKMRSFNDERTLNRTIKKKTTSISADKKFWAYLAGLLDTDGSFSIKKEKSKGKNPCYSPIISLSMTDARGINKIVSNCPFGTVYLIRAKTCLLKSCYRWSLHSKYEISQFLIYVLPFLRNKKEQAKTMKEFCDKSEKTYVRSAGIPEKELIFRETCYQKVVQLNKNGVYKPSLIDLEAQEQGNKGEGEIHAERLNEMARKGCDSLSTAYSS